MKIAVLTSVVLQYGRFGRWDHKTPGYGPIFVVGAAEGNDTFCPVSQVYTGTLFV